MKNETNKTELIAHPYEVASINGCQFLIMQHEGTHYISARDLVDYAEMNWKRARNTLTNGDNVIRFGSKWLYVTKLEGKTALPSATKHLFLRVDRAYLFMARINTDIMRSAGKEEQADYLLNKQIEWARALVDYETGNKGAGAVDRRTLVSLIKTASTIKNPARRQAIEQMIDDDLQKLGYLVQDPQQNLPL